MMHEDTEQCLKKAQHRTVVVTLITIWTALLEIKYVH
jgi:hypothetical protein